MKTDQDYWVKIPAEGDPNGEPWVGKLTLPKGREERWSFELVRNSDLDDNPFSVSFPFQNKLAISGLLDFQTPCTLVNPFVTRTDPGSLGVYHTHQRLRIEGIFHALIEQASFEDISVPTISEIGFSSDSFLGWFGRRGFDTTRSNITNLRQTVELPVYEERFQVKGLGHVTCKTGSLWNMSTWEDKFRSSAAFFVEFDEIQSLESAMEWCWKFETLFQFLTGINTKWPTFTLVRPKKIELGEIERNLECKLTFGRTPHAQETTIHPFECCHNSGRGETNLDVILAKFCSSETIFERIQLINYVRFAKRPLQEDFFAILPILEKYVRNTQSTAEEDDYLKHEKAFFDYVEDARYPEIVEFCKKHISLKNKKGPALKTLLHRAAKTLNEFGFTISKSLTDRIADRRGSLFHKGAGDGGDGDGQRLWGEVKGAAAILSLSTYRDLGIDIKAFEAGRTGNNEIAHFFSRQGEENPDSAPLLDTNSISDGSEQS